MNSLARVFNKIIYLWCCYLFSERYLKHHIINANDILGYRVIFEFALLVKSQCVYSHSIDLIICNCLVNVYVQLSLSSWAVNLSSFYYLFLRQSLPHKFWDKVIKMIFLNSESRNIEYMCMKLRKRKGYSYITNII